MKNLFTLVAAMLLTAAAFAQPFSVTFQVDMREHPLLSTDQLCVAGDFQSKVVGQTYSDWTPGKVFLTDNGTGVFTATVPLSAAGTYSFKYIIGTAWGNNENFSGACLVGGNRQAVVAGASTTLPVVCYNACSACHALTDTATVVFSVDMKGTPVATGGVSIAGDFQTATVGASGGAANWTPGVLTMTQVGTSTVYSRTVRLMHGGPISFKFVNGAGGWESVAGSCLSGGNRSFTVSGLTMLPTPCFASCIACTTAAIDTVNVRFQVDCSNMFARFGAPFHDTVCIAGDFQGRILNKTSSNWTPKQLLMTPVTPGSKIYQTESFRMTTGAAQGKFLYGDQWGYDEAPTGACTSGGNRVFDIQGAHNANVIVGPFCFGGCDAACASLGTARPVTFRVDVSNEIPNPSFSIDGQMQLKAFTGTHIPLVASACSANGIMEYTTNLYPGSYQYRFYNGTQEETFDPTAGGCGVKGPVGDTRRIVTVPAGTGTYTFTPFIFNDCAKSASCVVATTDVRAEAFFTIAPNPFADVTTIKFENTHNTKFDVAVTDITGKVVSTERGLTGNSVEIKRNNLVSGVYFATLTTENGARFTQKLIIE